MKVSYLAAIDVCSGKSSEMSAPNVNDRWCRSSAERVRVPERVLSGERVLAPTPKYSTTRLRCSVLRGFCNETQLVPDRT